MKFECDNCGKVFMPGNRPDGMPNGIGLVQKDGSIVDICADCICELGKTGEIPSIFRKGGANERNP